MSEAVSRAAAAAHNGAVARGEKQGQGGAAQIDGEVPLGGDAARPEGEPVQVEFAFIDFDEAFEAGHAGEHASGDGAAGDGEAGVGVGAEQVVEQTSGEHGIAEAGRGDE